jgi:hypothetical protein
MRLRQPMWPSGRTTAGTHPSVYPRMYQSFRIMRVVGVGWRIGHVVDLDQVSVSLADVVEEPVVPAPGRTEEQQVVGGRRDALVKGRRFAVPAPAHRAAGHPVAAPADAGSVPVSGRAISVAGLYQTRCLTGWSSGSARRSIHQLKARQATTSGQLSTTRATPSATTRSVHHRGANTASLIRY